MFEEVCLAADIVAEMYNSVSNFGIKNLYWVVMSCRYRVPCSFSLQGYTLTI